MEAITIFPRNKKEKTAFTQMAKAFDIAVMETEMESPYNAEFVAKIKRSEKNFAQGKFKVIKPANLWK